MSYLQEFILYYHNELSNHQLFNDMANCVESSPWHRERNVKVHTDMVVSSAFLQSNNIPNITDREILISLFAASFHDVGKPLAKRQTESGHNSFKGHEKISSNLWIDYAVTNWNMLEDRFKLESCKISFLSNI